MNNTSSPAQNEGQAAPEAAASTGASPAGSALERAGFWSKVSFSWVGPLLKSGWTKELEEEDARFLVSGCDDALALAEKFDTAFAATKVCQLWVLATTPLRTGNIPFPLHLQNRFE